MSRPDPAPSADVLALAQTQARIEIGLVKLADLIAAVEHQSLAIQARLTRIERCQDRLEKLIERASTLAPT